MPMLGSGIKQPREVENFAIYYGDDLAPTDSFVVESIVVSSYDGATEGLPVVESYIADTEGKFAKMFISGGVAGVYKITCIIMTDSGRRLEDEFKLKIREY